MNPEQASTNVPDVDKTREQLLLELSELRAQMAILGEAGVKTGGTSKSLKESEVHRSIAEAVERERKRLFDVLENLPAMICLLTPDYHVVFANRSFREKFGESNGKHCYEYCFGNTEPCKFCESYKVLETGKPHHWEVTSPDGRTIDVNDVPFTDADGSLMILEMDVDITERKLAEEKISHLASYPGLNPNPIVETDLDGNPLYVNPSARAIFPDLMEKGPAHPLLVGLKAVIEEFDVNKKSYVVREVAVNDSNFQETISIVPNKKALLIYALDVTKSRQDEERLRLTQFAVDNCMDSSIWIDVEGRIIYINDVACRNLGYTREELLSLRIWDIDPGFTYVKFKEKWVVLKEKGAVKFESVHRRKDGSTFPVEVSSNYLKYKDQEYEVTFDRDITLRKQDEKEIFDAKAQAELYLDLMGHDINNLNQIALGYLELAVDLEKDDEIKKLVEKPADAIRNSSKLIDNVRKLQKVKTGVLKIEAVDLDSLLVELRDQYLNVPGKSVVIDYIPGSDCLVMANGLLKDVFSNIIGNAIKHSGPSKSVRIGMRLERCLKYGRNFCRVTVEDDGPGIPDALKKRVFARFSKEKAKTEGKGLGLYLVKSLVEDFHGTVHVEDRVPGDYTQGARFVVMLPAAE